MVRALSQRTLTLLWIFGLGLCLAAIALGVAYGRPLDVSLPVGITSAVYVTSGYVMARRRPGNRISYVLMLAGAVLSGAVSLAYVLPATEALVVATAPASPLLLAYVLLGYPTGVLPGRAERLSLGGIVIAFGVLGVATVLSLEPAAHGTSLCPPCSANPVRVTDLSVFPVVGNLNAATVIASGATISVLCVRRWFLARGTGRRILAPVLFGGVVTALGFAVIGVVLATGGSFLLGARLLILVQALVPIGLAGTFLYVYAARGAVAGAMVQLGAFPGMAALEEALRRALGDPELAVALWSAPAGAYLDREGRRVDVDWPGPDRTVLGVQRDGQPMAVVVHDATMKVDPALVATVADTVRFSIDTTDTRDQLRARGGDVAKLPRGEVTFLFGDLEGSTEMLGALGDAYIDVLAELRRIVREVTDRFQGQVVDARADECFLAFAQPGQALAAAVELQRRLERATWPLGASPRMRIGLHHGTPDLTADGYVGLDVHRAARVMATASGGQIVASAGMVTAVGHLPEDVTGVPLGYVNLKGIPEPEFLYRIVPASAG